MGEKAKFKFFRHKKLWKTLDGYISMRKKWCQEVFGIGISISMNRKFIIKVVCLVLCLFIALNAVTQLLTMSNTAANIAGIVLFIVAIWIGVEVIIKFIKTKENEK